MEFRHGVVAVDVFERNPAEDQIFQSLSVAHLGNGRITYSPLDKCSAAKIPTHLPNPIDSQEEGLGNGVRTDWPREFVV